MKFSLRQIPCVLLTGAVAFHQQHQHGVVRRGTASINDDNDQRRTVRPLFMSSLPPSTSTHAVGAGIAPGASTHAVDPSMFEPSTNVVRREIMMTSRQHSKDPLSTIDFNSKQRERRLSLPRLAARLDQEVMEREWFVTGQVNPKYFHPDFIYDDGDVEICSLQEYARDVYNLFDQSCSRAEVVETLVNPEKGPQIITCTWRCSGRANLLWGVDIKPFIVTTHWEVDKRTGLISRQVDEYSLPAWDLLVSAFFPFLTGVVTAPPAPPVPPRRPRTPLDPTIMARSPFEAWVAKTGLSAYFTRPQHQMAPETYSGGSPLEDFVEFLVNNSNNNNNDNNLFHWTTNPLTTKNIQADPKKLVAPEQPNRDYEHLPTIRSPTIWDRIQAFAPDSAELIENLTEATRRTESRRARRFYYAVTQGGEDDDAIMEHDDDHHHVAPASEEELHHQDLPQKEQLAHANLSP